MKNKSCFYALILLLPVGLSGCGGGSGAPGREANVLQNRTTGAGLIVTTPGAARNIAIGGSALVIIATSEIDPGLGEAHYDTRGLGTDAVDVMLNGEKSASADFKKTMLEDGSQVILGRVRGLKPGNNTLKVSVGGLERSITLVDYPRHGPVFSGPRETPYRCMTQSAGLGAPLSPTYCNAPTQVRYFYMSVDSGSLEPLDPKAPRPADIATTTTSTGGTVPFIVRLETGTIDRAIYRIAILGDPVKPGLDPWTRTSGWNGRLVYSFGGGCGAGHTQGDANQITILKRKLLTKSFATVVGKGYAVATSTLNVGGVNCNPVLSAETAMMVKKHFAKTYGIPVYTIGTGGSGGAIQQYEIAAAYPGILDGIDPASSFPDIFAITRVIHGCKLLEHYFGHSGMAWSLREKKAVSGEGLYNVCHFWNGILGKIVQPGSKCYRGMPVGKVFDAKTHPDGVRCDIRDHLVDILGIDPKTHHARSFFDNTGVQYGLEALDNGAISPGRFIDLNRHIGGFDANGAFTSRRNRANVQALKTLYATGLLVDGAALAKTPIIDYRGYLDKSYNALNIHSSFYSYSMRGRLIQANGNANNQVILIGGTSSKHVRNPLFTITRMDRWLANVRQDTSAAPLAQKIARDKPDGLHDGCFQADGSKIDQRLTYHGNGLCNQEYPAYGDPYTAAGGPLTLDIMKCHLKPVDRHDYPASVQFTDKELDQLKSIFPNGVCDWSKPGVGYAPSQGTWITYGSAGSRTG